MKSFFCYYLQTFKNIAKNQSVLTTMILSVIFYSFFYPTAYEGQHAESLPIVIVDEEQSQLSNQIITQIQKSPNVEIRAVTANFLEAKQLVQEQQADGILLLPNNLTKSIRHGENGGIGIYLSAAYFLKTKQIGVAIAESVESTLAEYADKYANISAFEPSIPIHQIPLFNTLSGYGSYIFPAVAPVIIHQTIFLGLCMLIAGYRESNWRPEPSEFWALFAVALTIGSLGCYYLFGFTFWLYDYPRGGNFIAMLFTVPIFVACVAAMGMFLSTFLDIAERAGHVIVVSSVPLFILSGIAWPHSSMPLWISSIATALPSTHGVMLFVKLNQMGATLSQVAEHVWFLAIMAMVFLALAYYRLHKR